MKKEFWFDMDGTIANLYGVEGWLQMLENEDTTPYAKALPLVNMARLAKALHKAQRNGYTIGILSWTSRNGNPAYNEAVATAKREWLHRHLRSVEWDFIEIVPYGTPKQTIGAGVLFDDEEHNRNEWGDGAHTPDEIFEVLANL